MFPVSRIPRTWFISQRQVLTCLSGVGLALSASSQVRYCAATDETQHAATIPQSVDPSGVSPVLTAAGDLARGKDSDADLEASIAEQDRQDDVFLDTLFAAAGPVVGKFGFGGILGYCTGYAMKQASKVAMVLLGGSVVALQVLQYVGYIEVKWGKIRDDVVGRFDHDSSGQVGWKDIKHYTKGLLSILRYNGPTAGGFSTGIYLGFYRG